MADRNELGRRGEEAAEAAHPDEADEDVDAVAQSIEEVSGVVAVQRYVADPSGRAAVELNDSRWRESIVHLLDDEGV